MIPSPYNFVPLSENVYFPDWADKVSADVPFRDGISGTIDIKVTTKTPTYIRNGNKEDDDFFRVTENGKYAIPGTSFKGMLRNVVEIISFSKIAGNNEEGHSIARVRNHRYAIRDLYNQAAYTSKITAQAMGGYKPLVSAGWLTKDDDKWYITPCDFARVEQSDLEAYIKGLDLGAKQSAADKYAKLNNKRKVKFSCGPEESHQHSKVKLVYKKVKTLGSGDKEGTIVLTGQPSKRERGKSGRKHMEFIFFDYDRDITPISADNIIKDFIFIHSDLGENRKPNEEWAFWKRELEINKSAVPVFFLKERNNEIKSIGLALMYRLAYDCTIHDAINHTCKDHTDGSRLDLSETIFGRIYDSDGLKGRVCVETLTAQGDPQKEAAVKTVLGTPRPTYYPNYIEQPSRNTEVGDYVLKGGNYKTFMDKDCKIRGWKRYIVKKKTDEAPAAPTENVAVRFCPLPAETVFTGKIHIHNLRPQELGAVYWALTLNGNSNCCHSLGMAKPYGYGAVKVSVTGSDLISNCSEEVDLKKCKEAFTSLMEKVLLRPLSETDEVKALLAMANPDVLWNQCTDAIYPTIDRKMGTTFADFKKYLEVLAPWNTVDLKGKGKAQSKGTPDKNKGVKVPPKPQPELTGAAKIIDILKNNKKTVMNEKSVEKLFKDNGKIKKSDLSANEKAAIKSELERINKIRPNVQFGNYIKKNFS